jgi:hypothetical protein
MFPPMCSQSPCMNIAVQTFTSQSKPTTGQEAFTSQGWNASELTAWFRSGSS